MLSIHPHTVLLPTKHQHNFDDFCEEIRIVVPLEKLMFSQKLAPTSDIKACLPANRSINAQPFFSIIYLVYQLSWHATSIVWFCFRPV